MIKLYKAIDPICPYLARKEKTAYLGGFCIYRIGILHLGVGVLAEKRLILLTSCSMSLYIVRISSKISEK